MISEEELKGSALDRCGAAKGILPKTSCIFLILRLFDVMLVSAPVELGEFVLVTLRPKEPYILSCANFTRSMGSPIPCARSICTCIFQRLDDICLHLGQPHLLYDIIQKLESFDL